MSSWLLGARPRTLPAAVVPVAVGTATVAGTGEIVPWRAGAALVLSLSLQVGVNYANDYSDGVRGVDAEGERLGPPRLVGSGRKPPGAVKRAALASLAVAALAGLVLAVAVGWELLVVGAVSIAAAWLYTGGPKPYGYAGLGELFVFAFFGLVATVGSAYVHTREITGLAVAAAVPVGFLVTALLVVNNLRDIPSDARAGKSTLAVRLGAPRTRLLYAGLVSGAFASFGLLALWGRTGAVAALLAAPLAYRPLREVMGGAEGAALIPVLEATGRLHLVTGMTLAGGLWLTA